MTRQTWTAFVSAGLFVTFAVLLAVLPVPFVAWGPGGTENTLGTVKDQPIISVAGTPTYPTTGRLDLTIVSGTAADSRLTLPEALAGYWLPNRDTLPRDSVYPPGQSADEVERAETQMMDSSQSDAVVSALRAAGQPVTEMPAVASVTVGGPAHNRLLPGDLIQSVDGVATVSNESVGRQIRTHRPGEVVEFSVLRNKVPKQVSVTSVESNTQDGAAVVGITVGDGYRYAPTIRFDLGQQLGGPSAGLVFAMAIYDKITPGDLLRDLHVAGHRADLAGRSGGRHRGPAAEDRLSGRRRCQRLPGPGRQLRRPRRSGHRSDPGPGVNAPGGDRRGRALAEDRSADTPSCP